MKVTLSTKDGVTDWVEVIRDPMPEGYFYLVIGDTDTELPMGSVRGTVEMFRELRDAITELLEEAK